MNLRFKRIWIMVFILALFIPQLEAEQELILPQEDILISMDLQDANLKDVLKIFSIQSGLNFIASEGLQDRRITLYLDKVPLKEALNKLFKANNLAYEFDPEANIIMVKDWGKPQIETMTKVFYLKHASVSTSSLKLEKASNLGSGAGASSEAGITAAVKKLLSTNGSVIEDPRTNSIIVSDTPNRINVITQAVAALDVPIPQVMLEVEMLDVNKNAIDKLGVNWPEAIMKLSVPGMRVTKFPFWGSKADNNNWFFNDTYKSPGANFTFTNFSTNRFLPSVFQVLGAELVLDFLKSRSDTKLLARPRILTLNNEVAEIKITTQETVGEKTEVSSASDASGESLTTQGTERYETGVSLRVTPQINPETGEVTMFIMPKVTTTGTTITLGSITAKDPEDRLAKTVVKVKDGETIIIGGLINHKFSQVSTQVPFFSKIPVFGALFRHRAKDPDQERELIVFITPHIIKDEAVALAQSKKTAFPEREQSSFSGFDRQALISNSLSSWEEKIKK